tara:strand:+ start:1000 stop:1263 length:264 start_codon:yes stop_codon:yes gene_type:complete
MWIRKTAILHQLDFKEKTNEERLFRYCKKRMHESGLFIQKAIGWGLRQYSYVDGDSVLQFVENNNNKLGTISKKEELKAIKRRGKER